MSYLPLAGKVFRQQNGNLYTILSICKLSQNNSICLRAGETMVVYQDTQGNTSTCSAKQFSEDVLSSDEKSVLQCSKK